MAFPDDYQAWGGTTADFIVSLHRLGAGIDLVKVAEAPVTLYAGEAVDAAPITDVRTPAGQAIPRLRSDPSGNLPEFWIPKAHPAVWIQTDGGPRLRMVPRHVSASGGGAQVAAATATAPGIVELATPDEAIAGVAQQLAVTPAGLLAALEDALAPLVQAIFDLVERVNSKAVILLRNPDGSWPELPTPAPPSVIWGDLTGLPASDPPEYREGQDFILDPGATVV